MLAKSAIRKPWEAPLSSAGAGIVSAENERSTPSSRETTRVPHSHRLDAWALALALVLSSGTLIGYCAYHDVTDKISPFSTAGSFPLAPLATTILAGMLYFAVHALFLRLDRFHEQPARSSSEVETSLFSLRPDKHVMKLTVLFFVCWIPYLIARFPGNIDFDTIWQLMGPYGLAPLIDHHPWFDTVLFGTVWHLGDAASAHTAVLLAYSLTQMALTAYSFALCVRYLERRGIPRWLKRVTKLFFALYPAIPLFAMSMTKEPLFSWIWIIALLYFAELVRTKGATLRQPVFCVGFCIAVCLIMLTKKSGAVIVFLTALALVVYCAHNRGRVAAAFVSCLALYAIAWTGVLLPAWGVAPGEQEEALALPIQQVARVTLEHPNEIDDGEWAVLDGVFDDAHTLATAYVATRADNAKDRWSDDVSPQARSAFLALYCSWLVKYPATCAAAFADNTYPLMLPWFDGDNYEGYVFFLDNIPTEQEAHGALWQGDMSDLAGLGYQDTTPTEVERLVQDILRSEEVGFISKKLDGAYNLMARTLWPFFNFALFATWIPLFSLFYALRSRRWDTVAWLVPALAAVLSIFVGPVVIPRYIIPVVYATPLVAGSLFFRKSKMSIGPERADINEGNEKRPA